MMTRAFVPDECQKENPARHMPVVHVRALGQTAPVAGHRRVQWPILDAAPVRQVQVPHTNDGVHCVLDNRRTDAD